MNFKIRQEFCCVTFQHASAVGQTMHVTTAGVQRASLVPHVIQVTRTLVQRLMIHSPSMRGEIRYSLWVSTIFRTAECTCTQCGRLRRSSEYSDARFVWRCRDVTPSSLVHIYRRFGGPLCLRLLTWRGHFPLSESYFMYTTFRDIVYFLTFTWLGVIVQGGFCLK